MSAWSNSMEVSTAARGGKVDELGALVEKGGVVFIAFQDHVAAAAHPVIGLKILGDAPHHEAGVQPQGKEQPGDQGRGGGLAVGAGHHQDCRSPTRKRFRASGRERRGRSLGQHRLGLGVVPADDVAHHHQVRGSEPGFPGGSRFAAGFPGPPARCSWAGRRARRSRSPDSPAPSGYRPGPPCRCRRCRGGGCANYGWRVCRGPFPSIVAGAGLKPAPTMLV